MMRILEISPFSAGICGVWTRVLAESSLFAAKHEVHIFSSDIFRGNEKAKAKSFEIINNVNIHRFATWASFGQNTYFWNFEKEALKLNPDIIITHAYRQYYSTRALRVARKLNIPCILVTHAPFLEKKLRNWKLNLAVFLYDGLIGKRILNRYEKVIAITKWEMPYLLKLGCKSDKIVYVPNGIPDEFFNQKKEKEQNKILFLGRVAPIKALETLIKAFNSVKDKNTMLEFIGPCESDYLLKLNALIDKFQLKDRIVFSKPIYDLKEKIKKIDSAKIFVLPSKREAMPQALIEAMARGKIVVSSNTKGGKEIVKNNQNGFLFEIGDEKQLSEVINKIQTMSQKQKRKIGTQAKKSVEEFSWQKLIKKLESVYKKRYKHLKNCQTL